MKREKTIETCKSIVKWLIRDGFIMEISKSEVRKAIRIERGLIDPRSVDNWLRILEDFEYLIPKNAWVYTINPVIMPTEIIQKLREEPQTKMRR